MASHESHLISYSLATLAEVVRDRTPGAKQGPALKLALRVLLPHTNDRHYLDQFWKFAGFEDWDARRRACRPALGAIAASVGRVGYCDDLR
ncbi:MAG: hypothetical protein JWR80_8534 [Bradyrhizobium sp.]|nr:hypothetical protein [Bradyrhizobium sp.]